MTNEERIEFVKWAEKTHPRVLNNLLHGYSKYKEEKI
jgi:hypothetical protein